MLLAIFATLGHDSHDGHHHMWWGGGWWMALWGSVVLIGVIGSVAWAVRTAAREPASPGPSSGHPLDDARRILANRLASGEISVEEHRDRVAELDRSDATR